jgi:hypothetical protein
MLTSTKPPGDTSAGGSPLLARIDYVLEDLLTDHEVIRSLGTAAAHRSKSGCALFVKRAPRISSAQLATDLDGVEPLRW